MAGASLMELCPSPRRVQATLARARRPLERTEHAYGRPSGGVLGDPTGATAAVSRGPRPLSGARVVGGLVRSSRCRRSSPGRRGAARPSPPRPVGIGVALGGRPRPPRGPRRRLRGGLGGHAAPWCGLAIHAGAALGRRHGGHPVGLSPLLSWFEPRGHRAFFFNEPVKG